MGIVGIWYFWIYSALGYVLEKAFARLTRAEHQVRKCLLLPLCPVYGLGMLAVLALPEQWQSGPQLIFFAGLAATAVEYVTHWGYEVLLGVQFWDYTGITGNVRGRVCLPFSAAWGILAAAMVWWVQPLVRAAAAEIPPAVTYVCLLVFTVDLLCSARLLRVTGDVEVLGFHFGRQPASD